MKIIVVDDEMSALHAFLNEIIEEQGVEYKFYRDDIAAVCKYTAENAVDAAFLDINMPKMNGIELAEKLIKISPALKLVFITGLSVTESDLPENVRQHTAGFLYKPYDMSRLLMLMSLIKGQAASAESRDVRHVRLLRGRQQCQFFFVKIQRSCLPCCSHTTGRL